MTEIEQAGGQLIKAINEDDNKAAMAATFQLVVAVCSPFERIAAALERLAEK